MVSELASLSELVTIRDFLRFAVSRFRAAELSYGHGTVTALDDAAFLILETLHLPIDNLEPWLDARLTRAERTLLTGVIEDRVVTRKPSAYLTHSAYIGPHRFFVDGRVIVPRSFIGELLCTDDGAALDLAHEPERVLDLCTGSACLAIVAAHRFAQAHVVAVDVSRDALEVAKENVKRHGLAARVQLQEGDLFAALGGSRFDLILCNPPYVTNAAVASFPAEYKAEPVLAHSGGTDGMDLVRRVIDTAGDHLAPDGVLVMEVGQGRDILERDYPGLPFLWLDTELSVGEVCKLEAADVQTASPRPQRRGKSRAAGEKAARRS